jgi:hypothetical protein
MTPQTMKDSVKRQPPFILSLLMAFSDVEARSVLRDHGETLLLTLMGRPISYRPDLFR